MTPDEQQVLDRLCRAVIDEKDPAKLTPLVEKLNEFLAARERKPVPVLVINPAK